MKKLLLLMLLFITAISYAQPDPIPHKTREKLELSKAEAVVHIDTIMGQTSGDKLVKIISYTDFVAQLNATGLAGGGGTSLLPLTNIWTGTSNTFNNIVFANGGLSVGTYISKGNGDLSLNIGSNLYGGGGTGSYKQVTIGQWSNIPIQTTDSWVSTDYLFLAGNGTGTGGLASNAFWLKKNGDGYFAGTVVGDSPTIGSHFVTKDYGDTYYLGGTATGLEILDEGNGNGWRLIGRNAANYGNIGLDAIDFGWTSSASSTYGATGRGSFVVGGNNTASGEYTFSSGNSNGSSANYSFSSGIDNTSSGDASFTLGSNNLASGTRSSAFNSYTISSGWASSSAGEFTISRSFGEFVIGSYNTDYTPDNAIAFDADDRIFNIGIGASSGARADGFTVYKNGSVWMPVYGGGTVTGTPAYNLVVDANGKLITDALSAGGGGDLVAANNLSDLASLPTALINLGLENVDNTSDANKPVSTATQTQLDLKETIAQRTVVTASPYTTVLADDGKSIELNPGASTVTLDDTGIPVKFRQSIFNDTGGNVTISIAGGDTSKQNLIPLPDVGYAYIELMETNVWSIIIGSGTPGDMVLSSAQIVSGNKTFLDGTLLLRNVANTFNGVFTNTNTADRTYTLPNASGTVALLNQSQTWTGVSNIFNNLVAGDGTTNAQVIYNDASAFNNYIDFQSGIWSLGVGDGVSTKEILKGHADYLRANFLSNADIDASTDFNLITRGYGAAKYTKAPATTTPTTVLDLSNNGGNYANMASANGATAYTTTGAVLGGWVKVLINSTSQPTVDGSSTPISGATWVTGTNMYMVVSYNGTATQFYFLEI